jgi:hypothetical protein
MPEKVLVALFDFLDFTLDVLGSGYEAAWEYLGCGRRGMDLEGMGFHEYQAHLSGDSVVSVTLRCPGCCGTGMVPMTIIRTGEYLSTECPQCNGTGEEPLKPRFYLQDAPDPQPELDGEKMIEKD